jgi:hypothetical protein
MDQNKMSNLYRGPVNKRGRQTILVSFCLISKTAFSLKPRGQMI